MSVTQADTNVARAPRTRLSARPPAMRGYPYVWLAIFTLFMIGLFFVPNWGNDQLNIFNNWLIFTITVVGFYFVFGMSGQFAFSQAAFMIVVVGTVLFGTRIKGGHKLTFPLHSGGGAAVSHYGSHATAKLPGTAILVSIFFVSFALYYFINWKYLSELWLFR